MGEVKYNLAFDICFRPKQVQLSELADPQDSRTENINEASQKKKEQYSYK